MFKSKSSDGLAASSTGMPRLRKQNSMESRPKTRKFIGLPVPNHSKTSRTVNFEKKIIESIKLSKEDMLPTGSQKMKEKPFTLVKTSNNKKESTCNKTISENRSLKDVRKDNKEQKNDKTCQKENYFKRDITEKQNSFAFTNSLKISENDPRLKLTAWGLPDCVLNKYKEKGIESMFPWQAECLSCGKVLGELFNRFLIIIIVNSCFVNL